MILKHLTDQFAKTGEFADLKRALQQARERAPVFVEGIAPSSFPLIIASLFNAEARQLLVVAKTTQKMQELYLDLGCMIDEERLYVLPPWETLPYEFVSAPEKCERERITALYRLLSGEPAVVVTTIEGLIRRLPARENLLRRGLTLTVGDEYPFDDIIALLVTYGYSREYRVESFGHFAVKGGIIDIFLPSHENPVRLDFFGDTLDSIREFDIGSQVSHTPADHITLYPRKEMILLDSEKEKLYDILERELREKRRLPDDIVAQINEGELRDISGIEDLFPLVMESATLPSYLAPGGGIILLETTELMAQRGSLERTFGELYHRKRGHQLCLPPDELIAPAALDEVAGSALHLQVFTTTPDSLHVPLRGVPGFQGKVATVREEIGRRLGEGWNVIITTGFEGQARRLYDLLSALDPKGNFDRFSPDAPLQIVITPLSEGLEIAPTRTLVLTDHEIFGKSYRKRKQFKKKTSRPIESFLDLRPGDYVVHISHGIGVFTGIERMTAGGVERDFLLIEYAESDKLYVSLDQITMVQKYIGFEGRKPRVDHLGKQSSWNRIKKKVKDSVEEIARELIGIYSQRNALKGFQFPPDTLWQEEFESLFEYDETPDQITAIEDVKDDMEHPRPMDRLVCGDVGFGKTEVAIRAAFKGVMAGKQVAILVPTTVLAMQHFTTFSRRFGGYPIEIEMLSRFRSAAEIRAIKQKLAEGRIDIIVGTHALLSRDLSIRNLGLLVIDEEQRFGVKHKEQLRKFRAMVDTLTLSATPIPRTLHMAMAGIRDLSIISTPPENRQSIETYVLEENPDILRRAIMHEIERDGQVFYVHNRVQTIDAQATMLRRLVPEATCAVAHGQMGEDELEEVMIDFLAGKFQILISTSIIESGLDIPSVNTIIINRADTFGLSQLYQLKGRVGRSDRKAYAYLFYPMHIPLGEDAQKRLQVIAEYAELGSGFKIAMKDLEIRGAGNILGSEQSGNIMEVGFDLYTQMLEEAVSRLKGEQATTHFRTPVFLKTDFYIPDDYIGDERQKIEFYKRFESCETEEEVAAVAAEMADRFGPAPDKVQVLVELEKIRTLASALLLDEILEDSRSIRVKISGESRIDVKKVMKLISSDKRFAVDPSNGEVLIFTPREKTEAKRLAELQKWLQSMA